MSLSDIRERIDLIDNQLLDLLSERADLVHQVGEIKKKDGLQIYSPDREDKLLKRLSAANQGRLPEKSIRAIYREIMSAALALEEDLKIAYLGPAGTWTHQAAISKFGQSVDYIPQANFEDVFNQVERKHAHYGVVPIENSTEGAVNHTLDLFADSPLKICAQILLPIQNDLFSNTEHTPREAIRKIYSHPQVFGQCRAWLHQHFPEAELVEVSSTSQAAALAKDEKGSAAMGSQLCAEQHGLTILEKSVQDRATNTTRFLVIGQESCPPTGKDRTSIMFSVKDSPGSLYQSLKPFNELEINLSKIESRPSKKRDWEYFFFVDLKGHTEDQSLKEALEELDKHCKTIKVLGSYPDTAGEKST